MALKGKAKDSLIMEMAELRMQQEGFRLEPGATFASLLENGNPRARHWHAQAKEIVDLFAKSTVREIGAGKRVGVKR